MNAFKKNPYTTVCGIAVAVCQAMALIPKFSDYQYVFQGGTIIFTALLGIFASDSGEKEQ